MNNHKEPYAWVGTIFIVIILVCVLLGVSAVCYGIWKTWSITHAKADTYSPTVTIPLYGASSNNPPPQQIPGDVFAEMLNELRLMRGEMTRLRELVEGSDPVPQSSPEVGLSIEGVLNHNCIRCHRADVAETYGAGFAIFNADNTIVELSGPQKARIYRFVSKDRMPPAGSGIEMPEAHRVFILREFKP